MNSLMLNFYLHLRKSQIFVGSSFILFISLALLDVVQDSLLILSYWIIS